MFSLRDFTKLIIVTLCFLVLAIMHFKERGLNDYQQTGLVKNNTIVHSLLLKAESRIKSVPNSVPILNHITDVESVKIPENSSIFFIESNTKVHGLNSFSQCALESAAAKNPSRVVFLVVDKATELKVNDSCENVRSSKSSSRQLTIKHTKNQIFHALFLG